jgi:hypothetical protein
MHAAWIMCVAQNTLRYCKLLPRATSTCLLHQCTHHMHCQSVQVYFYKDSYLRFSATDFDLDELSCWSHLCNNSVVKNYEHTAHTNKGEPQKVSLGFGSPHVPFILTFSCQLMLSSKSLTAHLHINHIMLYFFQRCLQNGIYLGP